MGPLAAIPGPPAMWLLVLALVVVTTLLVLRTLTAELENTSARIRLRREVADLQQRQQRRLVAMRMGIDPDDIDAMHAYDMIDEPSASGPEGGDGTIPRREAAPAEAGPHRKAA